MSNPSRPENRSQRATIFPHGAKKPGRRFMLAGASAALLAGAAIATAAHGTAAEATDARLLKLCDEYHRHHDVAYAGSANGWEIVQDLAWEVGDQIATTPALTPAGRQAKAAVAVRVLEVENRADHDCRIALAVLRDLAGDTPRAAIVVQAPAIPPADRVLVEACDLIVSTEGLRRELVHKTHTLEDERANAPEFDRLDTIQRSALERIFEAPEPTTMAGALALARAALADAPIGLDGKWEMVEDAEWMAFTACEFMVRRAAA